MRAHITRVVTSAILALSLAACGGMGGSDQPSQSTSQSKQTSSSPTTSASGNSSDSSSCTTNEGDGDGLPTLKDNDTSNPVLCFPKTEAPKELKAKVIEQGSGPEIGAKDLISADYVGQVWGKNKPFDSSYAKGQKLQMRLDQLVPGWAKALAGKRVGDKVMISLPPSEGYGESGNPQAGIGGDDTIVFYVHIHDALSNNSAGQADAKVETDAASLPVEITGELGQPVTRVKVKDPTAAPEKLKATVIARGTGPKVGDSGVMFVAWNMTSLDGSSQDVTWGDAGIGPQPVIIGNQSLLDQLKGIPVGSRVLVSFPAANGGEQNTRPAGYAVVDILRYSKEGAPANNGSAG